MKKAIVTDLVHYVATDGLTPPGTQNPPTVHLAAIVTSETDAEGFTGLRVFNREGGSASSDFGVTAVQDEERKSRNTWHWPEREEVK